jgi:ABC-type dipeptide/oligopeptide/nickel transport system permease component
MLRIVIRRIFIAIPQLIGISLITFTLLKFTPGNFFDTLKLDPHISAETIRRYEDQYQLNKPFWAQYGNWLAGLSRGEFGYSFFYNIPVGKVIVSRLWNTFVLSFAALLVTWLVAVPLGIVAAVHRNSFLDRIMQLCSYMALSTPSFFLALLLLFLFSQSGVIPLGGMHSAHLEAFSWWGQAADLGVHLIVPVLALSVGSIGALQRLMRGNMLEVLRQQYILTARAKGLPENRIIYGHALRNAINPMITILGMEFSSLLSGAALIEIICNWPGLGSLMLTAVRSKDLYLVMASMMMGGFLFLLGNLLADLLLPFVDPRIRYDTTR